MKQHAVMLLRKAVGHPQADFRPGQWESIEGLLSGKRMLVVERTGWGKSMVYFLASKLLREAGKGPTLLISPLLSLMRNQIEAANRIDVCAATINSSNVNDWRSVEAELHANKIDILLISPERLANEAFRDEILSTIAPRVGLFVVDEAHCISDWGHDFRPDYRRIVSILSVMPRNIPVLATTATANDRVVRDVAEQLGDVTVQRGPLIRKSLRLQNIRMPNPAARLAWLAQYLPGLEGSGIIYTLTTRDAERVAAFLQTEGIDAHPYHAKSRNDTGARREALEELLVRNQCKTLVATVALGMGFDKPDLGFVIHFQRPGSVVHYYQQVGRAGRAVESAYGILFSGAEDDEIIDYFIRSALPPEAHVKEVLGALEKGNGASLGQLERSLNLGRGQIAKVLTILGTMSPSPVSKLGSKYYRTATVYIPDTDRIAQLVAIRREEQREMQEYMRTDECLMLFLARSLDDVRATACGRCANCLGSQLLPEHVDENIVGRAITFLKRSSIEIEPRKKWPDNPAFPVYGFKGGLIPHTMQAELGLALCMYGDPGWGELVRDGKYSNGRFDDRLVDACVEMMKRTPPAVAPTWVTSTPSQRHPELVPDFARRLADKLGLSYHACITKTKDPKPQKDMHNSWQQAHNLDGAFSIDRMAMGQGSVLLVDDMVDSRWTMTVLAALLRQADCPAVIPIALALNTLPSNGD